MRINCHCHVFNLQSVFTEETRDILRRKMEDKGLSDGVANLVLGWLTMMMRKGSGVDLDENRPLALSKIIMELKEYDAQTNLFEKDALLSEDDAVLALRNFTEKSGEGAQKTVDRFARNIRDLFADSSVLDGRGTDIEDVLSWLSVALADSIDHVTDKLMKNLGRYAGIVPLMMDITKNPQEDEPLLMKQTDGTRRQIFRYPGRVFPFFAINPKRANTVTLMQEAVDTGFVGVKIYPALDYPVNSVPMGEILQHCNDTGTPVLMHCMRSGFNATDISFAQGDPGKWDKLLEDYSKLKICFGHFGGDENFLGQDIPINSWTHTILDLMLKYPGRVYADVSAHTDCLTKRRLKWYFNNLNALIDGPHGDYILWGTDWFMIRDTMSEKNYWEVFEDRLSKNNFTRIAETNPIKYLGLPFQDNPIGQNIERQVDYIIKHRDSISGSQEVAPWLSILLSRAE